MEPSYYGKESASSLSMRRRNLMGARIATRAATLFGATLIGLCPKFGIFVATFKTFGWGTNRKANTARKSPLCKSTNGRRLVLCWLSHQPCEWVGPFLLSTAGTQERFFAFQRFSALTIQRRISERPALADGRTAGPVL